MIYLDIKLPSFFITGAMLRNGKFVDMHNKEVEFDFSKQKINALDAAPIYTEHGGKPVGYLTRIYTAPDDPNVVRYDGFVFDESLHEYLSTNPGVSAELYINNNSNEITITGMALTKYPAIESASIDGVIAMSLNTKQQEIADYIKENLDEIEPALLEKIAVIVSKYITERQYPDPSVEMSKAKEKIKELEIELSKRDKMNEDVKIKLSQLEQALSEKEIMLSDKEKELEAKAIELAEKEAKLKEYEAKIQEIELSSKKTELLSKIKAIEPEFDEEVILSKPLNEQISFLDTYYTIVSSKGKPAQKEDIQLSAPQNSVEQRYRKLFDL